MYYSEEDYYIVLDDIIIIIIIIIPLALLRAPGAQRFGRDIQRPEGPPHCVYIYIYIYIYIYTYICIYIYIYIYNLHLGLINAPPLILFLPQNDLFHYSFTIKKARNLLNVGQIWFTIHLLSQRPGRGAWDFINGGGLLIRGGDYIYIYIYIHTYVFVYVFVYVYMYMCVYIYIYI